MIARFAMSAALLAAATAAAPAPTGKLDLSFTNLRSAKGNLLVCITADPRYFPDCTDDPDKRFLTVPAARPVLQLSGLPAKRFAVTVHHDENANDKLDTFVGVPKEGIGFSRNPRISFGPPKFDRVALPIAPGTNREAVKLQYFL
ncbi:DUF2141 domain-containing protein [Novosphingopyxis sp. YJ-S2-01]|uniref:DUF2141 domain-containing protein n=1 Tax=Novosphingopyxis sp. YJ-S2-01 TaxID=2794021 RepID=UPI001E54B885|nr:DUF2141 domain-containing protein [Novosphingopyxis sp. YJ-S2-01]